METAYIIRNGVIIGSGTNSSLNPDSSSTYIINCTIVSETGLEIEVANYDGDFTKIKQTIADGGKVELRTNFNSSNYILEPSRIEEDYATFNTIDKNANITIKVTEYGINDVSYIDLNSSGGATIDDAITSTDTVWSSKKTSDEIADIESALDELENITRLTDFDEAIPEKGKNKIYYVNKLIGTYKCAQWRVESMYYDVSGAKQYRGVQRATSINGVDNIMLMREYYLDDNNVMRWGDWKELATMDKVPESVVNPTELDTNKFLKSGYYSLGDASNRTNLPAYEACTLLVFNAGYYIIQEIFTNVSNGMYYRKSLNNGSTWSAWTKVSTT